MKHRLTPKQRRFVDEYLIDLNATAAAKRAGYSQKTADKIGAQLLGKTWVAAAVERAQAKRSERTGITQDYVLTTIHDTVERCKQAAQVFDRSGNPVLVELPTGSIAPAYVFDAKNVLKGCELLGKHLKLFTDKHEHTGPDGGPIATEHTERLDVSNLSDEDLADLDRIRRKIDGETDP